MSGGELVPLSAHFVDDRTAGLWTGRPTSTIRRWGLEGRITRHQIAPHVVRYDIRELRPKSPANGPMKAPPLPERAIAA